MVDARFLQDGFDKRLSHVIEECGEVSEPLAVMIALSRVVSAAGKTQRWGPDSVNPLLPVDQQERNIDWLKREIVDLRNALDQLDEVLP